MKLFLQLGGVDDIAVVRQGQLAVVAVNQQGLGVTQLAAASGRVPGVPDGHVTDQRIKIGLPKYLGDQPHISMNHHVLAVGGGDASALLAAVLQGEEAEESQAAGLSFWGVNPYHPALFVGIIERVAADGKI